MSKTNELRHWMSRALCCQSAAEVKEVLLGFCEHRWTLEEKAILSSVYTPRVAKWLRDDDEKWPVLEELAGLCWRTV